MAGLDSRKREGNRGAPFVRRADGAGIAAGPAGESVRQVQPASSRLFSRRERYQRPQQLAARPSRRAQQEHVRAPQDPRPAGRHQLAEQGPDAHPPHRIDKPVCPPSFCRLTGSRAWQPRLPSRHLHGTHRVRNQQGTPSLEAARVEALDLEGQSARRGARLGGAAKRRCSRGILGGVPCCVKGQGPGLGRYGGWVADACALSAGEDGAWDWRGG